MQRRPIVTCSRFLVVSLCAIFALNLSGNAQVVGATVSGTLTDSGGRVVPEARITLTNTEQGIVRTDVSNRDGAYTVPNVVPGLYDIKVEASGFRSEVKKGLRLTVGELPTINFSLSVASVDQTIQVEDATSQIELGNSALSDVVSGETIRELPLNGRDWTQMATLEPGTATIRSQPTATNSSSRGNRGFGQQLTIAGGRPQLNTYRIDGINVNDYSNSSPGSSAGLSLGADAVGEFSVISSNYSATYGMTAGGVINAITRAGANHIHGSAYEFVRNDLFDAESYTDVGKLPFRRNQFGGTLGGPVIRDKTFLFGNYEGLRQVYTTTSIATVPSLNARNGILVCGDLATLKALSAAKFGSLACNPGGATLTLPGGVDPKITPYLPVWHVPTGAVNGDTAVYGFSSKQFTPENFFTIRGDQTFSQKDSMYVTYLWDHGTTVQPDTLNFNNQTNAAARQMLSLSENHIFSPTLYNALRLGANRVVAQSLIKTPGANPLGSDTSLGAVPGLDAPLIAVGSGVTSFTGGVVGGSAVHYGFTTPQLTDDVFLNKGDHQLKFGFLFQRIQSNILIASYNYGNYTFNSLPAFLTNYPNKLSIATTPPTAIDLRQSVFGAYAEDSWKIKKNLSVTAGLRYEPVEVPTETKGRLANLTSISGTTKLGSPLFANPSYRNFAPRVGFTYSPSMTNGKTVVSGGYGIFDVLPLTWMFNLQLSQVGPYSLNLSTTGTPAQGSFPTGLVAQALNGAGAAAESFIPTNPPRNYVQQYNLTIQQELPGKVYFKVGYVGNHGVHQDMYTSDANVPLPLVNTPGELIFPCGAATTPGAQSCAAAKNTNLKVNQNVGAILASGWYTGSNYSGLLVDVKQDLGKSLHWQAAFTWQKSLDGSSSVVSGTPFSNSLNQFLFHPLRGVSDYNIPRVFVANAIWKAPKLVRRENPLSYAVSGWELGGIYQISDGTPFTMLLSGDNLGLGNGTPLDFPDRVTGTGCGGNPVTPGNRLAYVKTACFVLPSAPAVGTRFGNEQRNSLRGPDFQELDTSLVKNFNIPRLGEGTYLQFRAEAFNIANHPNLSPPYTTNSFTISGANLVQNTGPGSASSVGSITTTSGSPRQLQLALKLVF
jgi:Carboxypeptidase regulatory-like domain/TonB dependent receptor/TonB-dependent Receptor Plug Domain